MQKMCGESMNNFYTYIYLDPRKPGTFIYDNMFEFEYEPFYVGKGKGNRIYSFQDRSDYLKKKLAKIGKPKIEFVIKGLEEKEALEFEKFLISVGSKK